MDDSNGASRSGIQVIARAAAVLRALKDDPSGLSLGQIAERVTLPRSTVQRIVAALQEERLVIAQAMGNGVRLGPELHALARAARYNIVDRCRPYLTRMRDQLGETVDLSVLRGGQMIFLDQVPGSHRLRTVSSVGELFPLTTTANGRACLAMLPEPEAEAMARAEWGRKGGDWPALNARLRQIRAAGLAEDIDDHTDGISALGIAFADLAGDLHAISVPIPSTRFAEQREAVAKALLALKPELARVLEG
ncbi:IclR family transcriptional regulator [Tabrizicola sp.]|uniref:IclR family transcriptional regulator n=1 Tax=Tabrizicola sp. TaxID=2005166 RepID=UPI003F2C1E79